MGHDRFSAYEGEQCVRSLTDSGVKELDLGVLDSWPSPGVRHSFTL